ncbi:hypothetical protein FACS1894184_11640 [Clostridia bacterium]|nr:hypothetical protein FACS1894184_11640 [Clostridia bacterium]
MIRRLNMSGTRAAVLLIALGVLIVYAMRLDNLVEQIDLAMFRAQWSEKKATINLFCDDVDRYVDMDHDWGEFDYSEYMGQMVREMDTWAGVYAALMDEDLTTISVREYFEDEEPLDPALDQSFQEAVRELDQGELFVPHVTINGVNELIRVYFRWVPSGTEYNFRQLTVLAMGVDALNGPPAGGLIGWCVGLMVVASLAVVVAVVSAFPLRTRLTQYRKEARHG